MMNETKRNTIIDELIKKWGNISNEMLEKMTDKELKTIYKKVCKMWALNSEVDEMLEIIENRE